MDDRERRGPIPELLVEHNGFDFEIRLLVGDYLLDNELLFERKALPDLVTSIKEGRLFSQTLRLR
jgi:ERCC4-type nuclease